MPTKAEEAALLHSIYTAYEADFYDFFDTHIEDWIDVCILEGSLEPADHEADYTFKSVETSVDGLTSYVFGVSHWEQDWAYGGNKLHNKFIHIPADFLDDPTPYQAKAQKTADDRERWHKNSERNRKIEKIANLSQEIERIKATL